MTPSRATATIVAAALTLPLLMALDVCTPPDNKCKSVKLDACIINSFQRWKPCAELDVLKFRGVTIKDIFGCGIWLNSIRLIRQELIGKTHKDGSPTIGLGNCLSQRRQPFLFGANMADIEFEGLERLNEPWLRSNGRLLFGDLVNKSVEDLQIANQSLTSANLTPFLRAVAISKSLTLDFNGIREVRASDFDGLRLEQLQSLQIAYNSICAFQLAALRNLRTLQRINLTGNYLYVDSLVFLQWAKQYELAVAVSTHPDCSNWTSKYPKCRVLDTVLSEELAPYEVLLIDTDCRYKHSTARNLMPPSPTAPWVHFLAVFAAVVLVIALISGFLCWRSVRKRLDLADTAMQEAVKVITRENVYRNNQQMSISGEYEKPRESVYDEVVEPASNEYCEVDDLPPSDNAYTAMSPYMSPRSVPCDKPVFTFELTSENCRAEVDGTAEDAADDKETESSADNLPETTVNE